MKKIKFMILILAALFSLQIFAQVSYINYVDAYEVLAKTEFKIDTPTGNDMIIGHNGGGHSKLCLSGNCKNDGGNLCKNSNTGTFYLNPGLITFRDTAANGASREQKQLGLFFDTNPTVPNWYHKGWRKYSPEVPASAWYKPAWHRPDTYGDRYWSTSDFDNPNILMIPHVMTDPAFKCYLSDDNVVVDTTNPNDAFYLNKGYITGLKKLKQAVISNTYSPLVININHPNHTTNSPSPLLGLDAGVEFLGMRDTSLISKRKGSYDENLRIPISEEFEKLVDVTTPAKVKTGWINGAAGNALLVLDLNEDGVINSGMELFGESTVMEKAIDFGKFGNYEEGEFAGNGFLALAQYDDNLDGKIDASDPVFSKLRLWLDGKDNETPDGITDEGELATLDEYNIVSFDVDNIVEMHQIDQHGNETRYRSSYKYKNSAGKVYESVVFDIYFVYDRKPDEVALDQAMENVNSNDLEQMAEDAQTAEVVNAVFKQFTNTNSNPE